MSIKPSIVYRYKPDDKYGRKLLLDQELYYVPFKSLNDPLEASIHPKYECLPDDLLLRCLFDIARRGYPNLGDTEIWHMVFEKMPHLLANERAELKSYTQRAHSSILESSGVISLSENGNHPLLWSHYAQGHTGFRIGFFSDKLHSCAKPYIWAPVNYPIEYPSQKQLFPLMVPNLYSLGQYAEAERLYAFTKNTQWSYEGEIRIYQQLLNGDSDRVRLFPPDSVESIAFGCRMPAERKQKLIRACKKKYPDAVLYEAHQVEYAVELSELK